MIELNRIYNEDCLAGMKKIQDGFVDLTVTSPPYDNLRSYNGNNDKWNASVWESVITDLFRITKDGGVVVWVVADVTIKGSETGTSFRQALHFIDVGFNLHDTMIYFKHNPVPVGGSNRYYQSFEYMFVFSKGSPKTFGAITEPRRNACNDKRTRRFKGFNREADGTVSKKETTINQGDPNDLRRSAGSHGDKEAGG